MLIVDIYFVLAVACLGAFIYFLHQYMTAKYKVESMLDDKENIFSSTSQKERCIEVVTKLLKRPNKYATFFTLFCAIGWFVVWGINLYRLLVS